MDTAALLEALYDVIDPEMGLNIVDLGLVYAYGFDPDGTALVEMTLTSPACPLTDVLESQLSDNIVKAGIAPRLDINWVWSPPWSYAKVTAEGREQLSALGFG